MAPIQYTASIENNTSGASIDSTKCESNMSKKAISSSVQSSQCQSTSVQSSQHQSSSMQASQHQSSSSQASQCQSSSMQASQCQSSIVQASQGYQTFGETSEQMSKLDKTSHSSGIKSNSEMELASLSTSSSNKNENEANIIQNIPMDIQTRGNFFEDSFFADVRENFQNAVNEVLEKCGESSSLCDNMTSYRKLRQLDQKEENQAGTISYGEKEHKIILDVHDFKQSDISVKIVENNVIHVTGYVEKKNGNALSTQRFHRQFTLPGAVDMTMVTSSMSSDGILTIIVPRLENEHVTNTQLAPGIFSELDINEEINQCDSRYIKAAENYMKATKSQASDIKSAIEAQLSSSVSNSSGICPNDKNIDATSIEQPVQMKIEYRGNFFEDTFFADVRDNFQKAVSEVLEKQGEKSLLCDDMKSYRNLRQRYLKEENQAVNVSYGEKEHKIVLDVNDFKKDDIKVQIIEDNTVQITGRTEKTIENAVSSQSFHRQFTLPGTVDMKLVTSSMSSDGILTVIIPRLPTKQIISNTEKENQICEESNLNQLTNQYSNKNTLNNGKCMKTCKTEESRASTKSKSSEIESEIEAKIASSNSNTVDVSSKNNDICEASSSQPSSMVIRKRGNFFDDSFFADVQENFQKAVSEVLSKYGESCSLGDDMNSYRNLRQRDLTEENQAATVSYGEREHKIVIDVNDFKQGDIKVKVVDDNKIQITGHVEINNGNSVSKQSFHRQFILFDTDMTLVTSSMSSDGILTVIIPRSPTKQTSNSKKDNQMSDESNLHKETNQCSNENTITTGQSSKTELSKSSMNSNASDVKSKIESKLSSSNSNTSDVSFKDKYTYGTSSCQPVSMTITKRGNFFDDSFFADVHENFQKAVREVLEKCGETSSVDDDMTSYRNLRQRNLEEENQAAMVSYGEKEHKIVIDVNDFKQGDIQVKVMDDKTIHVRGNMEKKKGNAISTQSFRRQFTLPGSVDMTLVTSSMSDDGILIVIIPRLPTKQTISNIEKEDNISKESNLNKEANQCSNKNTITTGESMKAKETKSSIISQESNIESVTEVKLSSSNSNTADVCSVDKGSKLSKRTKDFSNENAIITDKSMKAINAEETKSSMILQPSNIESEIRANVLCLKINTADFSSEDETANLNKETNECSNENIINTGKSMRTMKADGTESSIISQASNNKSGIEANLSSSNINAADICSVDKESNLNKETNEVVHDNATTARKSMKAMKTKSSITSLASNTESIIAAKLSSLNSNTVDICSVDKDYDMNKETNECVNENATSDSKSMKAMKTKSSINSQACNTESVAESKLLSVNSNTADICSSDKDSNLNKEANECVNENTTAGKSMKAMKTKSSITSHASNVEYLTQAKLSSSNSNTADICSVDKNSNFNKETNESVNINATTTGKSMKDMKTKSSITSQASNTESVTEAKSSSLNSNTADIYSVDKDSNLNKETNECVNENATSAGKSMKAEESKSSLISQESKSKSRIETNLSSSTSSISNTADVYSEDKDTQGASSGHPELMTIIKRGNFFEDSFFADVHENFQKAVSEVLEKCGKNSSVGDDMTSYRNLRQHDLKEENQATTVLYGEKEHKIILDVNDFKVEDIKLKMIENNTVQIKGHTEKKNGNTISSQSFQQQFTLPGTVDMTLVTSSISADGILTVIIPRLATKQIKPNAKKDDQICNESTKNKEANHCSNENTMTTGKFSKTVKAEDSNSFILSQASNKTGKSMEVMNNTKSSAISQKSNTTTGAEAQIVSSNHITVDVRSGNTNKKVNHEISRNIIKNNGSCKNEKVKLSLDSEECDTKLSTKVQLPNSNEKASNDSNTENSKNASMIIKKKEKFFEDFFFESAHANFKKAITEIVKKFGESSSLCDNMEAYRNLRQHNLQEENRAVTVSYGEKEHKIILDVHDFTEEDIKIQVVDNTIQVTGQIEKKNGNSVSTQSFHRQFTLPGTVDMASVTSSMSSDSILTIIVPTINAQFTENTHDVLKSRIDSGEIISVNNGTHCSENIHNVSKYAKKSTKHHIQQNSSCDSTQNSSSTLDSLQTPSHVNSIINKNNETLNLYSPVNLSIRRRGQFFQDSFFNDSQSQFDEAMKSILNEFGNSKQVFDTKQSYRNLRQNELKEEQQACSMTQDNQKHKIVIDVHEFMEGNINVKVVGETKLVVEGENQQQKGISMSSNKFNRAFVLPNKIDASSVQSSMSSDGILTIIVPQL